MRAGAVVASVTRELQRRALFVEVALKPGKKDEYEQLIRAHISRCFEHDRCMYFDYGFDKADASKVFLYEVYEDEAALKDHTASAHLDQYRKESEALVESHGIKTLSLASTGSVNCNYAGECEADMGDVEPGTYPDRKALFVTIDLEEGSKEEYTALITDHIQRCFFLDRCMYFDYGFDEADPSKVFLYEVYEQQAALNEHKESTENTEYREKSRLLTKGRDDKNLSLADYAGVSCDFAGECEIDFE